MSRSLLTINQVSLMFKAFIQWIKDDKRQKTREENLLLEQSLPLFLQPIAPDKQLSLYRADIDRLKTAWSDEKTWDTLIRKSF